MPDADDRFAQDAAPRLVRDASAEVVARFPQTIRAVYAVLADFDIVGAGGLPDEYEPEARTIVARLSTYRGELDPESVAAIVHDEFVHWFGPDIAGPTQRYRAAAADVLAAWSDRSE